MMVNVGEKIRRWLKKGRIFPAPYGVATKNLFLRHAERNA
jgi:hypothetical protein